MEALQVAGIRFFFEFGLFFGCVVFGSPGFWVGAHYLRIPIDPGVIVLSYNV